MHVYIQQKFFAGTFIKTNNRLAREGSAVIGDVDDFESIDDLIQFSDELFAKKKYKAALKGYEKILSTEPTNYCAIIGKANILTVFGKYNESLNLLVSEKNTDNLFKRNPHFFEEQTDAFIYLGEKWGKDAIDPLIQKMNVFSSDFSTHQKDICDIIQALAVTSDERAIKPIYRQIWKDPFDDNGTSIVKYVGEIGGPTAKKILFLIVKDSTIDSAVRGDASEELTRFVDSSDANRLIRLLKNKDPLIRENAAFLLGSILKQQKIPRAFDPLILALNDNDSRVRGYAIIALGNLGETRAIVPLISILNEQRLLVKENSSDDVFSLIIEALINIGNQLLSGEKYCEVVKIQDLNSYYPEKILDVENIGNALLALYEQYQPFFRNKKEEPYEMGSPEYHAIRIIPKITDGIHFWTKLAEYYYYNQDFRKALISVNIALQNKPTNCQPLKLKGKILYRLGKKREALKLYQEVKKSDCIDEELPLILADLCKELGEQRLEKIYRDEYLSSLSVRNMVKKYRDIAEQNEVK